VIVPAITVSPAAQSKDVNPVEPVTVTVADGLFSSVTITNPEGRAVKGKLSTDKQTWTTTEVLGYDKEYRVVATAQSATGTQKKSDTRFTTLAPDDTIYPSFFPSPDLKSVGVGQPMVVIFDKEPADRAAAERALTVTTTPKTEGGWYWWDDRTLHWRPKNYWKAGTKVTVEANIYGVDLGNGVYGETDRTLNVTVGKSKIAIVDDNTKHMKIYVDGKVIKDVPVSLGMNKTTKGADGQTISFVTPSGIYVAKEKYTVKRMTSASYGLPTSSSLGYDSQIPLAVRFSDSGIFVHSAPWSVDDQGVRNVSHGCINMPPDAARWFFDNFSYGDILEVKNTSTTLESWDGYGDWNLSWSQWQKGSELA
jgi:lipoprotein-anchoring transpeptidase ErfK/SrfK